MIPVGFHPEADAEIQYVIIAVMHLHRDPAYWKKRLQ